MTDDIKALCERVRRSGGNALASEVGAVAAERDALSEQVGKLYRVCNQKDVLTNELTKARALAATLAAALADGLTMMAFGKTGSKDEWAIVIKAWIRQAREALAAAREQGIIE